MALGARPEPSSKEEVEVARGVDEQWRRALGAEDAAAQGVAEALLDATLELGEAQREREAGRRRWSIRLSGAYLGGAHFGRCWLWLGEDFWAPSRYVSPLERLAWFNTKSI